MDYCLPFKNWNNHLPLELDVTLYNYGEEFNCSAYTETENGAQDVWVTIDGIQVYSEYSIKQGENRIKIVRI